MVTHVSVKDVIGVPIPILLIFPIIFHPKNDNVHKGQHDSNKLDRQHHPLLPPLLPFVDKEEDLKAKDLQEERDQEDQEVDRVDRFAVVQLLAALDGVHDGERQDKDQGQDGLAIEIFLDLLPFFKDKALQERMLQKPVPNESQSRKVRGSLKSDLILQQTRHAKTTFDTK